MKKQTLVVALCGLIVWGTVLSETTAADKRHSPEDRLRQTIEGVLQRETTAPLNRRAELAVELERHPEGDLLHWQTGYVRDGKTWRPAEAAVENDTDQLATYRLRREKAPATAAGQLELANWCHENSLPDQERAHLFAVLDLAGDQDSTVVLNRLGYRRFGNQWLDREQLVAWTELNRRALAAVKQWGARLEKIADQLHGSPRQRSAGQASLYEVTDSGAIPAIEYTLCGRHAVTALHAVAAFQRMPEYEATLALARQAVFAKEASVRSAATEVLKTRPFDEFVPGMIELLATPLTTQSNQQLVLQRRGRSAVAFVLYSSYLVARETENQFQISVLNTVDYRLNQELRGMVYSNAQAPRPGNGLSTAEFNLYVQRAQNDVGRARAAEAYQRDKQVTAFNDRTAELNDRIISVLAGISQRATDSNPQAWWKWWEDYSDIERRDDKRIVQVEETELKGDPASQFYRHECFVAGTPVWTRSGMVAIETVKVGDLVLAKNIDTGELNYKPVIYTSVRQPRPLVHLTFDEEALKVTGGHRFWVSGKGWMKARDMQPGELVHTVTGNQSLLSTTIGPHESTHNLVVDDYHSYFVGRNGLLVQDLPSPQLTNNVIPGFSRRQLLSRPTP